MSQPEIDYLGEGASDVAIARRLIGSVMAKPGLSFFRPITGKGKQNVDRRLAGLNAGAPFGNPVLVLRDLDEDADCPSALIAKLIPERHENVVLRVCNRTAKAWLMADDQAYAQYAGISMKHFPESLEGEPNLKRKLMLLADQGKARRLKSHLLDSRSRQVPDWASLGEWHANFATYHWDPLRAVRSGKSLSLSRTMDRLAEVASRPTSVAPSGPRPK